MQGTRAARPLTILAALVALAVPASAQADVRSGSVNDPRETQGRTLENGTDDIQFVSAVYDSDAGSLTISARFYNTPSDPNANRSFPPLDFSVGKACNEAMPLDGTFSADAYWDGGDPGVGDYVVAGDGSVRLAGFDGTNHAQPVLSDDHQTISVTFQHPSFVHQDWRCVNGALDPAAHGSDQFEFYFAGFAPAKLSPAIAQASMRNVLAARFGRGFTTSRPRWVACPQEQIGTSNELPAAFCAAEFRTGRTWRYVEGNVTADGPRLVTTVTRVRRYVRTWRGCSKSVLRKAGLSGTLSSNARDCSTKPAAQVSSAARRGRLRSRLTISSASIDRAGFAAVATFHCTVTRRGRSATALCRNSLGDAFRYAFTA
jgi:hypothetical protein